MLSRQIDDELAAVRSWEWISGRSLPRTSRSFRMDCFTLHNPIGAATIDGEEPSIDSILTPNVVGVSVDDIIGLGRDLPALPDDAR